jgi:hypothetical protein
MVCKEVKGLLGDTIPGELVKAHIPAMTGSTIASGCTGSMCRNATHNKPTSTLILCRLSAKSEQVKEGESFGKP